MCSLFFRLSFLQKSELLPYAVVHSLGEVLFTCGWPCGAHSVLTFPGAVVYVDGEPFGGPPRGKSLHPHWCGAALTEGFLTKFRLDVSW